MSKIAQKFILKKYFDYHLHNVQIYIKFLTYFWLYKIIQLAGSGKKPLFLNTHQSYETFDIKATRRIISKIIK